MKISTDQNKFKVHVVDGYRWSYGDAEEETLPSGTHDVDVNELPEGVDSKNLLNVAAANVGVYLLDNEGKIVALTTDNDGEYVVKGKDICANCNGNGPTGEEGDYDRLGGGTICPLCEYDNSHFDPGQPDVREEEPIPAPQPEREEEV